MTIFSAQKIAWCNVRTMYMLIIIAVVVLTVLSMPNRVFDIQQAYDGNLWNE